MPDHHNNDIERVEADHCRTLPHFQLAIGNEHHAEGYGNNEESDVAHEAPLGNFEGTNQCHRTRDHSRDEASGANQLAHCKTTAVGSDCCKRREDIGTAVAECQ